MSANKSMLAELNLLYQIFVGVKDLSDVSKVAFAETIVVHPAFEFKRDEAARRALRNLRLPPGILPDLIQDINLQSLRFFGRRGTGNYCDRGFDMFGGWISKYFYFTAMKLLKRQYRQPIESHGIDFSLLPSRSERTEDWFVRARTVVLIAIEGMKPRLREVMVDAYGRASIIDSAARLGISDNYVAKLRTKGFKTLQCALVDEGLL